MHCRVFCNLADSSSVSTTQEIIIFTDKKNEKKKLQNYTHVAIKFSEKSKKLRLFSSDKKLKAVTEVNKLYNL